MRENEELKMIKRLSKNFKGMKERFKNQNQAQFKQNAELFMSNLCIAYDINDIKLNHLAITAYHDVCEILESRLLNKSEKNLTDIWHFTLILKSFMEKFQAQAGKLYD